MSILLSMEDYTVAWLAPLYFEASAALLMLDEHHETPDPSPGQRIRYHLGRIGRHNVAIACFPAGEIGIGVAGSMVAEVQRDLPNLQVGLLVGIGAGIPSFKNDIRLGDVAVAIPTGDNSGVIGYDLVKVEPEEIRIKQWQNASHPDLRAAISHIRTSSTANIGGQNGFISHLRRFQKTSFERPQIPPRTPFSTINRELPNNPLVHYGCILSGNRVIKSVKARDEMIRNYNPIAIEMEAAGIMNRLPVAVIRGISDFADAEKTDDWQFYAAATAAAYAKELLVCLGPLRTFSNKPQILARPARISQAHLDILLDEKSKQIRSNLNWRISVVDLLKVLRLDSSKEARTRLARRWNILVGEDDDAVQNIAIHGVILDELAKNHGRIPDSLTRALSVDG